ncbi:MAG: cation:proton antiporter [Bauldia litoralis]
MDTTTLVVIAGGVVLFGLISRRLDSTVVTAPMIFVAFGVIVGNAVLGIVQLDVGHGFIHGLAEVTLILVLFVDAARIDVKSIRRDHSLPVRMLAIGMPLVIAVGIVAALALPLGLSLWEAALLAAILAPTDAALGQSVVVSPLVPQRIRQALNIESGLNDGIALPVVLLFAFLASAAEGIEDRDWLLFGAQQIVLGPIAGVLVGWAGARLIDRAVKARWMSESYEGPASLGLALLAFAAAEEIGGNGFIAAFVAGLVFGNAVRGRCTFLFEFAEAEGHLLTLLTFLIFGAALVPEALGHIGWPVVAYAVLSLTVVRMAPIGIAMIGSGVSRSTTAFLAWFGPRGLASILFALFVVENAKLQNGPIIMTVIIATVTLSVLVHGLTAAPFARWYGSVASKDADSLEMREVPEMPTRAGFAHRPRQTAHRDGP